MEIIGRGRNRCYIAEITNEELNMLLGPGVDVVKDFEIGTEIKVNPLYNRLVSLQQVQVKMATVTDRLKDVVETLKYEGPRIEEILVLPDDDQ